MFTKKELTEHVFFGDLAMDLSLTRQMAYNVQEELRKIYGKALGEIGWCAIQKLLELTKELVKLDYYITRDGYTYDALLRHAEQIIEQEAKQAA